MKSDRPKHNSEYEMLTDWLKQLQERLKDPDLDDWLVWSLKLTRDQIIKKIDILKNGKQNSR